MHFAVFLCFSSMLDSNPFFFCVDVPVNFFFYISFLFFLDIFLLGGSLFFTARVFSLSLFHSIDTFWFQRGRSADDRLGHYCNFDKVFCKKKKNCWLSICTSIQWQADWIKTSLGKNDFLRLFFLSLSNIILFMGMGRNWQIAMETIQSIWKYLPYNGKFRV